ncbi:acyltransferase family protein [Alloiococcus sp. CFN-8]|uniref:acyltransferase family protein n=1 Tax=Alloiococcus sp. CFN-8 TaxID=3416081 RepID=UPI003CF82571
METANKKNRIIWLDQLRAIGIIFVILGHVSLDKEIIKLIYAFHMPLFFFISGMTHREGKFSSLWDCIKYKAPRLILPHIMMNLLMWSLWAYNFRILGDVKYGISTLIKGILVGNNEIYQSASNATWFLLVLFLIEVIYYLCEKFASGDKRKLTLLVSILAIISYVESINGFNIPMLWHMDAVFTGLMFYHLGYYLFQYLQVITGSKYYKNKVLLAFTIAAMVLAGLYIAEVNKRVSMAGNSYGSIMYFYIAALLLILVVILIVMKLPQLPLLKYVGQNTLLYLGIHIPIIRAFERGTKFFEINQGNQRAVLLAAIVFFILIPIVGYINTFLPFVAGKPFKASKYQRLQKAIGIISVIGIVIFTIMIFNLAGVSWSY